MNIFGIGEAKKSGDEPDGMVPELTADELEAKFAKLAKKDPAAARAAQRDFLARTVKPRDRYGRRRIFDVASHTHANRAERRAEARAHGTIMRRGFNKPFVRADQVAAKVQAAAAGEKAA